MLYSIYIIKNLINSKVYIGRTYKNINRRFKEHLTSIHRKSSGCRKLVRAIKKYGKDKFYVNFIAVTEKEENSFELEKFFITLFNSVNNGYNLIYGGKQFKHSEETKIRISKTMKTISQGKDNGFYGKKHSIESKDKISNSNMGHPGYALGKSIHSDKSKKIISLANLGSNNYNTSLNDSQVINIKLLLRDGIKQIVLAKKYNVSKTLISNIKNGKTWSHIKI